MKKRKSRKTAGKSNSFAITLVTATLLATGISALLILIMALLMYVNILPISCIPVANTLIKIVGAIVAAAVVLRKCTQNKILFGAVSGAAYIVFAFLVFCFINGDISISLSFLSDIALGTIGGILFALLTSKRCAKATGTGQSTGCSPH